MLCGHANKAQAISVTCRSMMAKRNQILQGTKTLG